MLFQRDLQKTWASITGVILILLGLFGPFGSNVFGIFSLNLLHDAIHIFTGILFIVWGMNSPRNANGFIGTIYLIIAVLGFIWGINFLGISQGNNPDNYLHLCIGLISIIIRYTKDN